MKKIVLAALTLTLLLPSITFANGQKDSGEAKKTANLVYANWEEGIAYTNLAKVVLEDKMGYDVTITASDVAPAYASVAAGDQDAFMESWLPVLHKDYNEQYAENIVDLGHVYEGTLSGLAVPNYMYEAGVKTISDLTKPEVMDKLDSTITGIDAGAGIMKTTEENVFPAYGLDKAGYKLLASSGPAMMAALKDAYQSEEWIVVTAWKPHSMFGYFGMTFLEQDKDVVWGAGNIHIIGRKTISEDKPELAQFLNNMFLTTDEVGSLMVAISEADGSEEDAARAWLADNEDVVADWIP
ncbi:glycine betaine ABC transporter substrate-binding protein [Spirochaeta cellobiosiphila]|uniref:glycine betaine ABC transporter substrate-binding protein n=1 Tax=Spirochaeta cellobiosiphila TaxID=504483 RepID=UPI00041402F8|nr:glycine betaine ABC transporter substrate-binding protein [Spirochaeta cellobiosiphila]